MVVGIIFVVCSFLIVIVDIFVSDVVIIIFIIYLIELCFCCRIYIGRFSYIICINRYFFFNIENFFDNFRRFFS